MIDFTRKVFMIRSFFRAACLLLLSISIPALADITTYLDGYVQLECELKPIKHCPKKAGRHPHKPSKIQPKNEASASVLQAHSTNWSGYAVATNLTAKKDKVTTVSGSWVVPQLLSTPQNAYSSFWVGIDGYSSNSVEQLGTEHDWLAGKQQNYAWFEMFPNYGFEISGFPVNVGDVIQAEVDYLGVIGGKQKFQLSIVNHTHQAFFKTTKQPPSSAGIVGTASAEWIAEAPSLSTGTTPLADFQNGGFTNCTAKINGVEGGIVNGNWQTVAITMVKNSGSVPKAIPLSVGSNAESFTVAWKNSGP